MKPRLSNLSPQRITALVGILLAVMIACGAAWRIAYWAWQIAAPTPVALATDLRGEIHLGLINARPWFGMPSASPEPEAEAQSSGEVLRLVGVFAGGAHPAAIIGAGNAAPQPFLVGESIAAGISLKTVAHDHVIVLRGDTPERIALPENSGATAGTTPGAAALRGGGGGVGAYGSPPVSSAPERVNPTPRQSKRSKQRGGSPE